MRKISLILFVAIIIALTTSPLILSAHSNPAQRPESAVLNDPDKCRDANGNEICPFYIPFDTRINSLDAMATIVGYCHADHSLEIWGIFNNKGEPVYTLSEATILASLKTATSQGRDVLINDKLGFQVWALASGLLKMTAGSYQFIFAPEVCGITGAPQGTSNGNSSSNSSSNVTVPSVSNGTPVASTITTAELNFRAGPSKTSQRIGGVPYNVSVNILGSDQTRLWLKVIYNNQVGWIYAAYTKLTPAEIAKLPIVQ
jgi:hypothetical protein